MVLEQLIWIKRWLWRACSMRWHREFMHAFCLSLGGDKLYNMLCNGPGPVHCNIHYTTYYIQFLMLNNLSYIPLAYYITCYIGNVQPEKQTTKTNYTAHNKTKFKEQATYVYLRESRPVVEMFYPAWTSKDKLLQLTCLVAVLIILYIFSGSADRSNLTQVVGLLHTVLNQSFHTT